MSNVSSSRDAAARDADAPRLTRPHEASLGTEYHSLQTPGDNTSDRAAGARNHANDGGVTPERHSLEDRSTRSVSSSTHGDGTETPGNRHSENMLARVPDDAEQRQRRIEARRASPDPVAEGRILERQADELIRPPDDPDTQRERTNLDAWRAVGGIRSGPATFFVPGKSVGLEEPRWKPGR
jgi:hypothetical protein